MRAATKISYRESHKYAAKGAEYERHCETQAWERFLWSRERKILLGILQKYFAGRDVHLLDFACGTGRITSLLENRVKTSTGVDVSGSMLAIAREKLKRTEIIEADITTENILKPRKFNLITVFRFFLNAEPELRSAAIGRLVELLAEDGRLVFNNHHSLGSPWIKLLYAPSAEESGRDIQRDEHCGDERTCRRCGTGDRRDLSRRLFSSAEGSGFVPTESCH